MQIIEHDHQGALLGDRAEQPRDAVEQPEPRVRGIAARKLRDLRAALANGSDEVRELRRPGHQCSERSFAYVLQGGAQHLQPRPECRRPLVLVAPAPEHAPTLLAYDARQLLARTGLPDPGLAREQHQAASTRADLVEGGAQPGHLALTADKDRPRRECGGHGLISPAVG